MRVFVFSVVRLFCETLAASLKEHPEVSEVVACHLLDSIRNDAVRFNPGIVLFHLINLDSLREVRTISGAIPDTPILALAVPETAEQVIACADAGVCGYVPPQTSVTELHSIMKMALNGECVSHPKIVGGLLREVRRRCERDRRPTISEALTSRECEILNLVGSGLSNKQIANKLVISVATVKNHLHNIFAKLQVTSRAQAISLLRNEPWVVQFASESV